MNKNIVYIALIMLICATGLQPAARSESKEAMADTSVVATPAPTLAPVPAKRTPEPSSGSGTTRNQIARARVQRSPEDLRELGEIFKEQYALPLAWQKLRLADKRIHYNLTRHTSLPHPPVPTLIPENPTESERKEEAAEEAEATPVTPEPITLLPETAHTLFPAGCAAVKNRAAAWLAAVNGPLPFPALLHRLVFEYAAPEDNPCSILPWISDRIAVKNIELANPLEYCVTKLCWLDNDHIVYLENNDHIVYRENDDMPRGLSSLVVRAINTLDARSVYCATEIEHISCSPDGTIITTIDRKGVITFWDKKLNQCGTVQLNNPSNPDLSCTAWSPDGTMLAVLSATRDPSIESPNQLNIFSLHRVYDPRSTHGKNTVIAHPCYDYIPRKEGYYFDNLILKWSTDSQYLVFSLTHLSTLSTYTIHIPTKMVKKYDIPHENATTIGPLGTCLLTTSKKVPTLPTLTITPFSKPEDLPVSLRQKILLNCTDSKKYFTNSLYAFAFRPDWQLSGLLILSGTYTNKNNYTTTSYTLFIDEKSGNIIKAFNDIKGSCKVSPDGSKMLFKHNNTARILTPICKPQEIYTMITRHQAQQALIQRYTTLMRRISLVCSLAGIVRARQTRNPRMLLASICAGIAAWYVGPKIIKSYGVGK